MNAGTVEWIRILASVLFYRKMRNAREFARYWIGNRLLHSSGLDSYMKRFYGVAPDQIDIQLAQKRMLWISERASLKNLIRRAVAFSRKGELGNRQFVRPKEGFKFPYSAAVEQLRENGVVFLLGAAFRAIERTGSRFLIRIRDRTIMPDRVISTIPINHMEEICGLKSNHLATIALLSLSFSFVGNRGFSPSILYNFSHEGARKRPTVYSDFYGLVNGREISQPRSSAITSISRGKTAESDFRKHVGINRLFDGDLRFEGMVLETAYPIYSEGSSERAALATHALEALELNRSDVRAPSIISRPRSRRSMPRLR